MPYRTPDAPGDGSRYVLFRLPPGEGHISLLLGALVSLTYEYAFIKDGSELPHETAETFAKVVGEMLYYSPPEVGTAIFSLRDSAPANWIPCMGQNLAMADWPELMAVYPSVLKNYPSSGQFFVPDLRGRMLIGDGTDGFGFNWPFLSVGGSRTVTLTQAQMPAHTHGESIAIPAVINGGLEAPASAATASTGTTGSAGSGQAHDNMPPYGVCHMFIVGRLFE